MTTYPVFDGHNDTLLHLHLPERGGGRSFFVASERGHIDLPRARQGGLAGGFFAIFVPGLKNKGPKDAPSGTNPSIEMEYAQRFTIEVAARLLRLEREKPDQVRVVRDPGQLEDCVRRGVFAMVLHIEGAEAIDANLDALEVLHAAGLRSLGPVWSRSNIFAHGVPFLFPSSPDTGPGLTGAGRELVRACNHHGILIDLSHLNEKGFWDVANLSQAPLVATHSNAHALCPSPRNLTDRQLDAIAETDGMVGVNFHVGFVRPDGRRDADTPLGQVLDHIDYIVERIGIDRVGFGSDFDGATMPRELGDVTGLPRLIAALEGRGYDEEALKKITHSNWLRVLKKTWKA